MRIALLSNVTIDLLAEMLKKDGEVYLADGFDTWQQEMMMQSSGLYFFKPEAVVVLIHANAYIDIWNDKEKGELLINEWRSAFSTFISNLPGIPVFVSSIDISNIHCQYGAERRYYSYFENLLIDCIEGLHENGGRIYVLPVQQCIADIGRNSFYSSKMWYLGSMPYSMKGMSILRDLILRFISATKGAKKKCIAVDLDNTLWGGVIGEDGIGGIVLSGHKEGERYKDVQRILKKMKDQGVMLAILSKNNKEDVDPVFSHPDMVLQRDDFVAEIINWESKTNNIRKLADTLNIGLDAIVFFDDNPAEQEQMKSECPEVTVIDFPKDTSRLPAVVSQVYEDYFFALEVTREDSEKTTMYRAESLRKKEAASVSSVDEYLNQLDMKMQIHWMRPEEMLRVVQLINKTNQFNVTTKRYSQEEVYTLRDQIITVHMSDKYGDHGLTAVLILDIKENTAVVDSFLMSCRVMGRNAEIELFSQLKRILAEKGIEKLKGDYTKTPKNRPVEQLYDRLGFELLSYTNTQKHYEATVSSLPVSTGVYHEVIVEL